MLACLSTLSYPAVLTKTCAQSCWKLALYVALMVILVNFLFFPSSSLFDSLSLSLSLSCPTKQTWNTHTYSNKRITRKHTQINTAMTVLPRFHLDRVPWCRWECRPGYRWVFGCCIWRRCRGRCIWPGNFSPAKKKKKTMGKKGK